MRARLSAFVIGWLSACTVDAGNDTTTTGPACTAGNFVPCQCPDGSQSMSLCGFDGVPGQCSCPAGTDATGSESSSSGSSTAESGTSGETTADTTAAASTGCDGSIYAGRVDDIPSVWSMGGMTGLEAGALMCAAIGGDHPCDYEEVKMAADAGELDGMVNFTAWIHRTTIENVDAVPSQPSPGGRCVDWTYAEDTLADGEWAEFTEDGLVYHLDPDTFYDGLDASHADPMTLPCAMTARAVLCCNAAC